MKWQVQSCTEGHWWINHYREKAIADAVKFGNYVLRWTLALTIIAAGLLREDKACILLQLSWQRNGVIFKYNDTLIINPSFLKTLYLRWGNTPVAGSCSWRTCSCRCPGCCTRPGSPRCRPPRGCRCRWRAGSSQACRYTRSWPALPSIKRQHNLCSINLNLKLIPNLSLIDGRANFCNQGNRTRNDLHTAHSFSRYVVPLWAGLKLAGDDLLVSSDNLHRPKPE